MTSNNNNRGSDSWHKWCVVVKSSCYSLCEAVLQLFTVLCIIVVFRLSIVWVSLISLKDRLRADPSLVRRVLTIKKIRNQYILLISRSAGFLFRTHLLFTLFNKRMSCFWRHLNKTNSYKINESVNRKELYISHRKIGKTMTETPKDKINTRVDLVSP